jgi:peptidoglycan pentaglycine glycine transferase (the first glycine)
VVRYEITAAVDASSWDAFVDRHPHGQFQQGTAWAETKVVDGWAARWLLVLEGEQIVGGAQALLKPTRAGRIGFINKGPLVAAVASGSIPLVVQSLLEFERREHLRALLVHPADRDEAMTPALREAGFNVDTLLPLITSTLAIDVSQPLEHVERQLRGDRRLEIRQAARRGVTVVDGGEADIPRFYQLMLATCEYQRTRPNPSTLDGALALWRAFDRQRRARLSFALVDGRPVATALSLAFGDRVTIWKVGWDRTAPAARANTLLAWDSMRWAVERGCRWFDFAGIDRGVAEAKARGSLVIDAADHRRDVFKLGFGGEAWLLPRPLVHFASLPLRALHRWSQTAPLRSVARALGVPAMVAQ